MKQLPHQRSQAIINRASPSHRGMLLTCQGTVLMRAVIIGMILLILLTLGIIVRMHEQRADDAHRWPIERQLRALEARVEMANTEFDLAVATQEEILSDIEQERIRYQDDPGELGRLDVYYQEARERLTLIQQAQMKKMQAFHAQQEQLQQALR